MSRFIYKAKDGPEKTVEGELEAGSRSEVVARLDAMGYSPVWVREKNSAGDRTSLWGQRIGLREITVFTRQLASLTKSGVPILKALSTIADQTENKAFSRIVKDMESTIRDGSMLSEALSKYPALFPELYVNMVRSGESGGVLDTILIRLAESREKEEEVRRKVQSAVAYPILVVVVGVITVFVLLIFFLPRVASIFKDYGYDKLPLPTKMIIGLSDFFSESWYWLVLGIGLFLAVFKRIATLEKGRTMIDRMKLGVPLMGKFIKQSEIARFARTLALLIQSGISIERALGLSGSVLNNSILREEVEEIRKRTVNQGISVSAGLKKTKYFPPFVANMAAVGEEGGKLDESMMEIALFYENEVEQQSRLATSLLEPLLILIVGLVVGFIVAAMLLPIFELSTIVR
ncbi:MAG: type II secretion system F family protein [Kiritimatiellae bacterium]|nr:type II secretion system F family protein [Kiritimatiellia bacterium]MDD5521934.1 type II secretion system F family protein [Kiritimatiellia bacterium]